MKKNRSSLLSVFLTAFAAMFLITALFAPMATGKQDKKQDKVTLCHNGHTITVGPEAAEAHLKNHPNDYLGPCIPTSKESPR